MRGEMNEIILEAATRVLERNGPEAFTTSRVAEVAGVSVGSLYQYYPNKASLLFCLHEVFPNLQRGERLGLCAFGGGFTFGAGIVEAS